MCNVCSGCVQEMAASESSKTQQRLDFLQETLLLLNRWQLPVLPQVREWRLLCEQVHKVLVETEDVLTLMQRREYVANENFDVFELSLRRYYQSLDVLGACRASPSGRGAVMNLLSDARARQAWQEAFGERVLGVSWTDFH